MQRLAREASHRILPDSVLDGVLSVRPAAISGPEIAGVRAGEVLGEASSWMRSPPSAIAVAIATSKCYRSPERDR